MAKHNENDYLMLKDHLIKIELDIKEKKYTTVGTRKNYLGDFFIYNHNERKREKHMHVFLNLKYLTNS